MTLRVIIASGIGFSFLGDEAYLDATNSRTRTREITFVFNGASTVRLDGRSIPFSEFWERLNNPEWCADHPGSQITGYANLANSFEAAAWRMAHAPTQPGSEIPVHDVFGPAWARHWLIEKEPRKQGDATRSRKSIIPMHLSEDKAREWLARHR